MKAFYNLIVHSNPDFWTGSKGYVDFRKDRFLEHTVKEVRNKYTILDDEVISKLKDFPTLFAVEGEKVAARVGKVTDVQVLQQYLRIYYEFDDEYVLPKGKLKNLQSELDISDFEFYRTHWAIKNIDLLDSLEDCKSDFGCALKKIKRNLDIQNSEKQKPQKVTKVIVVYACNSTGKTRLSKLFTNLYKPQVLYYNAFLEDLFSWDNDDYVLKFDGNGFIFQTIQEQGLDRQIIDNFQKFTGLKLEPAFDILNDKVTFGIHSGDEDSAENIKISRGEESVFKWSVFYTVLETAIEALNESHDNRSTNHFNNFQYIVIDDPVSSMDDTRIITIALELANLITKSNNQLKFFITTHHALFFNILFNLKKKGWCNYILSKSGEKICLNKQLKDSPFAYHHIIISEIKAAIDNNNLKKYHFNLFRALLEKTANFLGYSNGWKSLLPEKDNEKDFLKTLDHYSHNSLSDLEPKYLSENDKKSFKGAFDSFIKEYKWYDVKSND